jgi:hypothetical protein
VFTAQYALSPCTKQTRFVFKELNNKDKDVLSLSSNAGIFKAQNLTVCQQVSSKNKNIRDLYRGINEFQRGYQPRINVV